MLNIKKLLFRKNTKKQETVTLTAILKNIIIARAFMEGNQLKLSSLN